MPHIQGHSKYGDGFGNTKPSAPPGQNPYGPHIGYGSNNNSSNTNTTSSQQNSNAVVNTGNNNYPNTPPPGTNDNKNNNNDTSSNSSTNNSSNVDVKNNQQTVEDFIKVGDTDAKFESYTTVNYANKEIQTVTKKVNQILKANPKWTKMDAINYLDGKWTKMGYNDNQPRWNNGRVKDLEVSDEIKSIKDDKDYNTWGGGLRSKFEGNWGTLTDKNTYNQNLTIRANSQHLEPGSPAFLRNKQLSAASKSLSVNTSQSIFDALGGFIMSAVAPGLGLLTQAGKGNKREAISEKEKGLLQSNVLTQEIQNLMSEYNLVSDNVDDSMDMGSPNPTEYGRMMALDQQLRNSIGGDIPLSLRSMTMDGDNLIFNKPMNEGEFKNFKSRLRLIEENNEDDNNNYNQYGARTEDKQQEEASEGVDDSTTIDLVDPYIGLAWWQDRGGFEKLFGLPLPYQKKNEGIQLLQEGGSVRPASMINDPNAAPGYKRADDVAMEAEAGDFIMGYPAMQQNGVRVRSLVEQAMLRAKNSGVKIKGYKKGDKVDILAHNDEMHIPNELIPYVEGGYTTLKKLNKPSKHREGDAVKQEGFMEKPEQTQEQDNMLDSMQSRMNTSQNKKMEQNKEYLPLNDFTRKSTIEKPQKDNVFYKGSSLEWFEDNKWESIKKSFVSHLPDDLNTYQRNAYTNVAMNDLYNSLKTGSPEDNRELFSKLKNQKFLEQLHKSSKANMLMSNAHRVAGRELNYKATLSDNGIAYSYEPSNLFSNKNTNGKIKYKPDNTLINFLQTNENDGYKKNGIHVDSRGNETIGYGHKIQNDEEKKQFEKIIQENNGVFPQELAKRLLIQDITVARSGARKVYDNFVKGVMLDKYNSKSLKSKTFDSLDKNRQMMLTELAFNLGSSENTNFGDGQDGLAEFDDFMRGVANNDYSIMQKEYKRLNLDTRNKNFYSIFLSPSLDKL